MMQMRLPLTREQARALFAHYAREHAEQRDTSQKRRATAMEDTSDVGTRRASTFSRAGAENGAEADPTATASADDSRQSLFLSRSRAQSLFSDVIDFGVHREAFFYFLHFHRIQLPDSAILALWDQIILPKWRGALQNSTVELPSYMAETFIGQWITDLRMRNEEYNKAEDNKEQIASTSVAPWPPKELVPIEFVTDLTIEVLLRSGMWVEFAKEILRSLDVVVAPDDVESIFRELLIKNIVEQSSAGDVEKSNSTKQMTGFLPFDDCYRILKGVGKTSGMDFRYFRRTIQALGLNFSYADLYDTYVQAEKEERLRLEQFQLAALILVKERLQRQFMRELGLESDQIFLTMLGYSALFILIFLFLLLVLQSFGPGHSLITTSVQVFFAAFVTFSVDRLSSEGINLPTYLGKLKAVVKKSVRVMH
ncbi:unnamed protein product [Amoebophrya sp. A25]|nr:unnamed protein product [Amoebophrya sp. A25]|eukprot:GSA25T00026214001.1